MQPDTEDNIKAPLYVVLGRIAGFWIMANAGYFLLFPIFGVELSYNESPIIFAAYFAIWAAISAYDFRELFETLLSARSRIWKYAALSLFCAALVWMLLYVLSLIPQLTGPVLAPYSDLLFATPWYFLPKSIEVLMQQILITALIFALAVRFHSLKKIMIGYAATFGLAHLLLFVAGAPGPYVSIMTAAALISTLVFPYLILRVRGGFVIAYSVHLIFYIVLAMILHSWPPPMYIG